VFKVELSRVGSALVPRYASPSIDRFSNLTSMLGTSIPTLFSQNIKRSMLHMISQIIKQLSIVPLLEKSNPERNREIFQNLKKNKL
jgi:hypothetical protein